MKLVHGTGKLVGKVVTGTKSAPIRTKRRFSTIKNELSAGYKSVAQ